MGNAFFNSLKWAISVSFIIGGIACINFAEKTESAGTLILAVFSFGGAYIMSTSWRNLPWKAVVTSIVFVALCGVATHHVPQFLWDFFRIPITMDYYMLWCLLSVSAGIPLMTILLFYFEE